MHYKSFHIKSIIVLLAILLAVIFAILILFPQIPIVISTKLFFSYSKTPKAYIVPERIDLKDDAHELQYMDQINTKDYTFQTVWKLKKHELFSSKTEMYDFGNNRRILVYLEHSLSDTEINNEEWKSFDNHLEALYTTPDQITLFLPYKEAKKKSSNLILKPIYTAYSEIIYHFQRENIRGFQFGNPEKDKMVIIHFFGIKNELYQIEFHKFTQKEINVVLMSIEFN